MNVRELIDKLRALDQNATVIYESDGTYDTEFLEADFPYEVKARPAGDGRVSLLHHCKPEPDESEVNCVLIGSTLWKH
jgi:hypothetical protein